MKDDRLPERSGAGWKRRTILKLAGAGAGLSLAGVTSAKGNPHCPDCPDGTLQVAKYEYNGDTFEFEEGICDPVEFTQIEDKEGEENEPIRVCFETDLFLHDAIVKAGQFCEEESIDYENDPREEEGRQGSDTYTGCIDVSDNDRAISHITFCAGVCYQVDFVTGDPAETLEGGPYGGGRNLVAYFGSTADEEETVTRNFDGTGPDGCQVEGTLTVDENTHQATTSFTVDRCCELSLVSYLAPCPEFSRETADQQVLFDYAPDNAFEVEQEFCPGEPHVLTVDLPELTEENIETFCE